MMKKIVIMIYQLRFGKHTIAVHYEPRFFEFKKNGVQLYTHKIVKAWVIDAVTFYPDFADLKISPTLYNEEYLPRIIKCLSETFKQQKKSKTFIKAFFDGTDITATELREAEAREYGAEHIKKEAVKQEIIKPEFDNMVKTDLFKWLVAQGAFDLNLKNSKKELLEECERIYELNNKETEIEEL